MKMPISGLLVLNKPTGISSRQALDCVARILPRVRMGHAGTLDPMASGVLVVCLGKATRLIQFVQRMRKEYQATLRLGFRSDTHDLEGLADIAAQSDSVLTNEEPGVSVDFEALERCLAQFRGDIMQVPPQHSAVHVGGKRAYELARAGHTVQLAARQVTIDHCRCTRFAFPEVDLDIRCSSGTYVRSIVRDVGDALSIGAVMTRLVRTAVGRFRLSAAVALDDLAPDSVLENLRPFHEALQELPGFQVTADQLEDVRHGRAVRLSSLGKLTAGRECSIADAFGEIHAVGKVDVAGRIVQPHIVLMSERSRSSSNGAT